MLSRATLKNERNDKELRFFFFFIRNNYYSRETRVDQNRSIFYTIARAKYNQYGSEECIQRVVLLAICTRHFYNVPHYIVLRTFRRPSDNLVRILEKYFSSVLVRLNAVNKIV